MDRAGALVPENSLAGGPGSTPEMPWVGVEENSMVRSIIPGRHYSGELNECQTLATN